MLAVLFAVLSGALFGVFTLTVRAGLTRGADPEAGALVITGVGFLTGAVLALPELASGAGLSDLWPFVVVGAIVPGISQILFILAVRDAGPSRAAILIGTAPLISVLIALLVLGEPFRPPLLAGTALIVAGGAILARERARPAHFRALGAVLALTCAALFAVRDNAVRFVARGAKRTTARRLRGLVARGKRGRAALPPDRSRRGLPAKLRVALPAFAAAGVMLGSRLRKSRRGLRPRPRERRCSAQRDAVALGGASRRRADRAEASTSAAGPCSRACSCWPVER